MIAAPTATPAARQNGRSTVLIATAHPDDETLAMGGTIARLADEGRRVVVVCATRGEAGWIADPLLATRDTLGAVREQELRRAAQILGVDEVCLLDYRDGTLEAVAPAELAAVFAAQIRRRRPEAVITWGPDGGYGHPDHRAVSAAVTGAFQATAAEAHPGALYYVDVRQPAIVRGWRWLARRAFGRPLASLVPPPAATTAIDISRYRRQRLKALAQHRTQLPADIWLRGVAPLLAPRNNFQFSGVERFHRAFPPVRPGERLEATIWRRPLLALAPDAAVAGC